MANVPLFGFSTHTYTLGSKKLQHLLIFLRAKTIRGEICSQGNISRLLLRSENLEFTLCSVFPQHVCCLHSANFHILPREFLKHSMNTDSFREKTSAFVAVCEIWSTPKCQYEILFTFNNIQFTGTVRYAVVAMVLRHHPTNPTNCHHIVLKFLPTVQRNYVLLLERK